MQERYGAKPLHPPRAELESEGPRAISRAVEKNRGLTPHRRKDIKNPRVKVPPLFLAHEGCSSTWSGLHASCVAALPDMHEDALGRGSYRGSEAR